MNLNGIDFFYFPNMKQTYTSSFFILRTPTNPISQLIDINGDTPWASYKDLKEILKSFFHKKENALSLYLASEALYKLSQEDSSFENEKICESLLKYFIRTHSRCTPFGYFAGCSIGYIENSTEIILHDRPKYEVNLRLDMDLLCEIKNKVEKANSIKANSKYYPNSSLYKTGNNYRFVKYEYINNSRQYELTSFKPNELIELIINKAKFGATYNEIVEELAKTMEEAQAIEFTNSLILAQIIVNEFEINVTGPNDHLRKIVNEIDANTDLFPLKDIVPTLEKLNRHEFDLDILPELLKITELIKQAGINVKENSAFQVDLYKPSTKCTLSKSISNEILEGALICSYLNGTQQISSLEEFK